METTAAHAQPAEYPTMGAPPAVPSTIASTTYDQLTNESPDRWPEVLRELTATAGALDGLHRIVVELGERLAHVLVFDVPADPTPPSPSPFPVDSFVGQRVRALYDETSEIIERLSTLSRRLAV